VNDEKAEKSEKGYVIIDPKGLDENIPDDLKKKKGKSRTKVFDPFKDTERQDSQSDDE